MTTSTKIWTIVAVALTVVGIIVIATVILTNGGKIERFGTVKYETNIFETNSDFNNISIDTDTADIRLLPSADGKCKVECYEGQNERHSVLVKDGELSIKLVNEKKWYEYIGINWGTPKITVYLPKEAYTSLAISTDTSNVVIPKDFSFESIDVSTHTGNVDLSASVKNAARIKATTGNIKIENTSSGSLDLSVSTGKISLSSVDVDGVLKTSVSTGKTELKKVSCKSLVSNGDTGDLTMTDVVASDTFSIERSTGDVRFERCDAHNITITTDTGDVTGSLLSEKIFSTDTDTGRVNVPVGTSGGICRVKTDTGDIKITVN